MQTEATIDTPFKALNTSALELQRLRSKEQELAADLAGCRSDIQKLSLHIADRIVNGETSGDRLTDFGHVCHQNDAEAASQLVEQLKKIEKRMVGRKGELVLLAEHEGKNGHWLYLGRLIGEELCFDLKNLQWSLPTDGHVDVLGLVKSDIPIQLKRKTEPWKASFQKHGNAESLELIPSTQAPTELTHEFYIGDEAALERIADPQGNAVGRDYKQGIRHAIRSLHKLGIDPRKYPMLTENLQEDRETCLAKLALHKTNRDKHRLEMENASERDTVEKSVDQIRDDVNSLKHYMDQAVDLGLEDHPLVKNLREEYQL
jgi:hypothetical protein